MTKEEIVARQAQIQNALNQLGQKLIENSPQGIQLLTEQLLLKKRIEDGDYQPGPLDLSDDPVGQKVIDNDT